ncbi:MAG: hypothetical protein ACOCQ2_00895 [Halanaerobiales bacterium]
MKEVMKIKSREQLELITDPISLSILNLMEDQAITKRETAKQLDEDLSLINKYIDRLQNNKLIKKIEEDNKTKYKKNAETYELGSWNKNFDGNPYNHWILGLIHHLESNITDILKLLPEDEDSEEFFNSLGYEDTSLRLNKLFLDREEAQELHDMLTNFIKKHNKRPDNNSSDKKPYELAVIFNPDLPYLKKKLDKNN